MAETSIEWTSGPNGEVGYTFNPVEGCEKISPGCKNCYAERKNKWLKGGKNWGPGSPRLQRSEAYWRQPAQWNAEAHAAGQRRKVFCASVADVFEAHLDWVEPRARLWKLIRETPNLDWLLLTKRPENLSRLLPWRPEPGRVSWGAPWPYVWVGVTGENQKEAEQRIPILQSTPAVVHFVSVEPQLELVDLTKLLTCPVCGGKGYEDEVHGNGAVEQLSCHGCLGGTERGIDWVICGGESGTGARPFDIAWARSLRDQCAKAGVSFFMKQLGRRTRMLPKEVGGDPELPPMVFPMRKGEAGDPRTWPEDLRVRQWPRVLR